MGWTVEQSLSDLGPWAIAYFVGCGVAFALILIYLGERLATRSLLPLILLAAGMSVFWPILAIPVAIKVRGDFRFRRRAKVRYRHIVRLLLRRKARLRRAGDAIYRAAAARSAARTPRTRQVVPIAVGATAASSPLTRYCPGCRRNVSIVAVYCSWCGRKLQT